jgi:hypothetical protein
MENKIYSGVLAGSQNKSNFRQYHGFLCKFFAATHNMLSSSTKLLICVRMNVIFMLDEKKAR